MEELENVPFVIKLINISGAACMYACMLEHPQHFAKKKEKKREYEKKEKERERERLENYGKVIR